MCTAESSRSLMLSTEEQEELSRSNKKVKNVGHAGFREGMDTNSSSPWQQAETFKDRLLGEVSGAYTQAFSFEDPMEDVEESDDEMEALREGLVAVKFSKDLKQEIRNPWTRALIVKVYGRTVGFNFIHNKLLGMWKPAGRLDCVGLGHGFFLTRLSLKEDYENILRKGPWFIGGHFLSIRPWEPNFHPATANVSSVAVWIRLNELPIEYYNARALHQIGKSIGNVLRIDAHTATESRGKFARICVQIDINKPLVTAILIGKFEQPVSYEGIQKLCFGCGRVGHQKNQCPYIIRHEVPTERAEVTPEGSVPPSPCEVHVSDVVQKGQSSNESVNGSGNEERTEGTYGPWIVVARKRNGTKNRIAGRSPMEQMRDQAWRGSALSRNVSTNTVGEVQPSHYTGKDAKRKISPSKEINGPKLASSLQRVSRISESWAKGDAGQSLDNVRVEKQVDRAGPGDVDHGFKPTRGENLPRDSVKGKKAMARAKANINSPGTSRAAKGFLSSQIHFNQGRSTQRSDGDLDKRIASEFLFTATACPEMAVQREGSECRSESELKQGSNGMEIAILELNGCAPVEGEAAGGIIGREVAGGLLLYGSPEDQIHGGADQPPGGFVRDGFRSFEAGNDAGVAAEERMDLEEGGDVLAGR